MLKRRKKKDRRRVPRPKAPDRRHNQTLNQRSEAAPLTTVVLLEVLCAVHLSSYVEGPFHDRGGLMIVGPPGALKSTFLALLEKNYNDVVLVSDMNVKSLNDYRDQIASKTIRTLVLPEYAKLYERHLYTALNLEGHIRALAGEGFTSASFEDSRINRLRARCTILSAMTPKFQTNHFRDWEDSGFNRRFLWALIRLKQPDLLERSVENWELVNIRMQYIPPAPLDSIPNTTTLTERQELRRLVKAQPGGSHAAQVALLTKVLAVLKWWYALRKRPEREAIITVRSFAHALGKEGAELVI